MIVAETFRIEQEEDIKDLLRGLTLLGTGGGGRPDVGRKALSRVLASGKEVRLLPLTALRDQATVCAVAGVGSIAPTQPWSAEERRRRGYPENAIVEQPMVAAVRALTRYVGKPVDAVFPVELGPGNSTTPIAAAAELGIDVLDCDCAGRAIPEMTQSTVGRSSLSFTPAAFADPWGNVAIVTDVASPKVGERLGKLISIAAKDPDPKVQCARAAYLMKGADIKRLAISGGYSKALAVGKAIAIAIKNHADPAASAARCINAKIAFRGLLSRKVWESKDGYMYGHFDFVGTAGSAKVWFKNENHICWINNDVVCTSPDLIMLINSNTGETYTNTDMPEGINTAILVARADQPMRTEQSIRHLGPQHFGFDMPFVEAKV